MAKKKKAEEHENLERWLVSYADFMTLLFATFVVLYALAQSDAQNFDEYISKIKAAFEVGIMQNSSDLLSGSDSLLDGREGATNPVMLEYVSPKYEQTSYEQIEKEVNKLNNDGVTASIEDRGLVIRFDKDSIKFAAGSADIDKASIDIIEKVARIIKEKFSIHFIEVAGHTDSDNVSKNSIYPSNWELSSARASSVVRALIKSGQFNPNIFSAVGYGDTAPLVPNISAENKAKNRRVEVVVLKNKHRNLVKKDVLSIIKEVKEGQAKYGSSKDRAYSEAIQELVGNDKQMLENVIDVSGQYQKEERRLNNLEDEKYVIDGQKPGFMEQ